MNHPYLSDSIHLQTQKYHQTQQLLRLCLPHVHFVMLLLATQPTNKTHVTTWYFHENIGFQIDSSPKEKLHKSSAVLTPPRNG
ncbi:hypothetical protein DPMN_096931 [Dreissena polymorpha]|uniref:Uncharacterized protein n=1 Tax=Dreissena polymorpha TaxID=45954 RepID=A0A9D4L9C5_DREPO|nr:hypothetical protein DPMN_096931 [Dreissena polymorpha]